MKTKLLYISLLTILCIGLYGLGRYEHVTATPAVITEDGPDFTAPTPYLHLVYGDGGCPNVDVSDDYGCIYKLSHSTLEHTDMIAAGLIADPATPKVLLARLKAAQSARDAYFDGVCGLDEMLIYGGSGMDLEHEACRYYYARQYLNVLQKLLQGITNS
jgi:hypothetical protein